MDLNPPIAVFCYNRPKHLEAVLQAIERSQNRLQQNLPVFIFCDAPKKEADAEKVAETLQVARQFGKAKVRIREKNYGFHNITEGITELCNQFGQAIIIEDDVIVAPDFLPYMCKALEQYRHSSNVFGVTGFMYFDAHPKKPELFFQPYAFIWGWATWKRAWDHFTWQPQGWQDFFKNKRARYRFNCLGSIAFSKMVEKAFTGKWNTWDAQWLYTVYRSNGLFLSPHQSLTWNCGVGGGTHGCSSKDQDIGLLDREYYIHGNLTLEDFKKVRLLSEISGSLFPKKIVCNKKAVRRLAISFLKEALRKKQRKRLLQRQMQALLLFYHRIALFLTLG